MTRRRTAVVALALAGLLVPVAVAAGAPAASAAPTSVTGAVLEWAGNLEMQSSPPLPGCNYFSAGASDGSQEQYRTTEGAVSIRTTSGVPTWATRCDGATTGTMGQRMVLGGGTGTVDPQTGASTIAWSGTWTVNFYTGLLPFTITDPVLSVAAGGTGTITATLGGWAGEIGSTTRTPLPPQPGVVVASISGVPTGSTGFVVTPRYAGVEYDAPAAGTPQNRTKAGWGSWPLSFVQFHEETGLASYWYSSGGSADAKKAPSPITVRYSATPPTATSTTLGVSPAGTAVVGTTVRLSAVVLPVASGTVRFSDGTRTLATVALGSGGAAAYATTQLAAGRHSLRATFTPTNPTAAAASSSAVVARTVVVARSSTALTLAKKKAARTTRVRATVTVSLAGTPLRATGPVRITKGTRVLATGALRNGTVTVRLPKLRPGKHKLVATCAATPTSTASRSVVRVLTIRR